jgi:hypothetical protein
MMAHYAVFELRQTIANNGTYNYLNNNCLGQVNSMHLYSAFVFYEFYLPTLVS